MKLSEPTEIATRVRDGMCVLGCMLRDVHYASCADYSKPEGERQCRGCAPSPVYPSSAVCSRCFGRFRMLLRDTPDLVGRLRSLADPTKAMLIEAVKVSSRPVEAVAPVGPDLLDAVDEILLNLRDWATMLDSNDEMETRHTRLVGLDAAGAYTVAAEYVRIILANLERIAADPQQVVRLAEAVTVLHPDVDGERAAWSVADAMNRWGAERRDRHVYPDVVQEDDREESVTPVREWYDPLLTIKDAAERHGVTAQAVRKWVASGDLPVAMRLRGPRGSVMTAVHASQVDRVAARMREMRNRGNR